MARRKKRFQFKWPFKKKRRGRKKKFKFPVWKGFKLKPATRKKLEKIRPLAKLITLAGIGYLVYAVGAAEVPKPAAPITAKPKQKIEAPVKKKPAKPAAKAPVPKPKPILKKPVTQSPPPTPTTSTVKSAPVVKSIPYALPKRSTYHAYWSDQPKIIFVIDDIGHKLQNENLFRALNNHVTYAILPLLRHTRYFANLGHELGAEIILHLPLETRDGTVPGPGLITSRMSPSYVMDRVNYNLNEIPYHVGANNHMGSLGTSDPVLMQLVLKEFKRRGLFFLDSYTSSRSVIVDIGKDINLPVLKRDIFLDNTDELGYIKTQLRKLEPIAIQQGWAIAIGHDRANTLSAILTEIPRLKREGFEIISLSELLDYRKKRGLL